MRYNYESHEKQFKKLFVGWYKNSLRSKVLSFTKGSKILDVGCGEGMYMSKLDKNSVVGVDMDDSVLLVAKKYGATVKASADKLPFKDNTFDSVYCSEVLEHIEEPKGVCIELNRVCKIGGRIIIAVPNDILSRICRFFLLKFPLRYPGHIHALWVKDIVNYMGKKPIHIDYAFSRLFPLATIVVFEK